MPDKALKLIVEVDDKGTPKIKKFEKGIGDADKKTRKFHKTLITTDKGIGRVGATAAKVTGQFLAMGAAVAGAGAVSAVKKFAEFETALVRLGNVGVKNISQVKDQIMALDPALGSVTELTRGYYQVVSAGVTEPVAAMKLLTTASQVAKEANIEQSEVVKGLAAAMGAYKDELKTASDAADLLYTIERTGITSIQELIPHIGNLANLAAATGINVNEMGTALAQATASGAGTSIAVTQLESLLRGMLKPTSDMTKALADYGGAQGAIQKIGFQKTLEVITEKAGGTAEGLLKMFGRAEAVQGILQVSKGDFDEYNTKLEAMTGKTGAQTEAWERYRTTLKSIWETFQATIGQQLIIIGEQLAPELKRLSRVVSENIVPAFHTMRSTGQEVITMFNWMGDRIGWLAAKIEQFFNFIGKRKEVLVDFLGTGSTTKPLGEKTTELAAKIEQFFNFIGKRKEVLVDFLGTGSTTKPLGEKTTELAAKIEQFFNFIGKRKELLVDFLGTGSPTKPLGEKTTEMADRLSKFASDVNRLHPTLTVDFRADAAMKGVERFVSQATERLINLNAHLAEVRAWEVTPGLAAEAKRSEVQELQRRIGETERSISNYTINVVADSPAALDQAAAVKGGMDGLGMRWGTT